MQEQRARANGENVSGPVHPVGDYDNFIHNGLPKCSDALFRHKISKIEELRQQHADFYASQPTDPEEMKLKALNLLGEITDIDEMLDQTEALLVGIRSIAHDSLDESYYAYQAILTMARMCEQQVPGSIANLKLATHLVRQLEVQS